MPADDEPRECDALAVTPVAVEVACGANAVRVEQGAQVPHRMAGERESGESIVGVSEFEA